MRKLLKRRLALLLVLALALTNMVGVALASEEAPDAAEEEATEIVEAEAEEEAAEAEAEEAEAEEEAVEAAVAEAEAEAVEAAEAEAEEESTEVTEAVTMATVFSAAVVSNEESEDDTSSVVELDSGTCGDDLTWVLTEDGVLTISGTGDMEASRYGDSTSYGWYSYYQDITSVVINDGVTSIGDQAFYLVWASIGLTSVTIPDSVTSIGSYAFASSGLTNVTIPSSVDSIGSLAFDHCTSLASVTIENGVTTIGDCAFTGCTSLTSITIPASVTFIGGGAFGGTGLTSITFEGDAPTFGEVTMTGSEEYGDVFENVTATAYYPDDNDTWTEDVMQDYGGTITWVAYDPSIIASGTCGDDLTWTLTSDGVLTISGTGAMENYDFGTAPWSSYYQEIISVIIENKVTSIGHYAFENCLYMESVSISETVKSIGMYAFYRCIALSSVNMPDSVESIGDSAFRECEKLSSVTIPSSVESIGRWVFINCYDMVEIIVDNDNPAYSSQDGVLFNKDQTELILYPDGKLDDSYVIPSSVTSIASAAFGNSNLVSIIIGENVAVIEEQAFSGCSTLECITIPESVTSIGDLAFYDCDCLKTIIFLGDAPTFGSSAFFSPTNGGITATAYYPIDNETWTEDVLLDYAGNITWVGIITGTCGDNLTWTLTSDGVLTISGTGEMWDFEGDEDVPWIDYISEITSVVIEDGVTSIGSNAFSGCSGLTSVTIPASVTVIGMKAFCCENLTTIVFEGDAPTTIYSDAFYGVTATAYYPADNDTWTEDVMLNYGGTITWVEDDTSGTASGSLSMTADAATVAPGDTVTITVRLESNPGIGYLQLDVSADDTYVEVSNLTGSGMNDVSGTWIRAIAYAVWDATENSTYTGQVLTITCTVKDDAPDGITTITVTPEAFSYPNADDVIFASASISLTVCDHTSDEGVVTTEATCTEDGVMTCTCTKCGAVYTEAIEATGHSYDEGAITTAATCTEDGVVTYTCSVCGDTYTDVVVATGHTVVTDAAVAATCSSTGLTEGSHCSVCNEVIVAQEVVEKLEHTWDEGVVTTEATSTTDGVRTYTCTVCGETKTEAIPASGGSAASIEIQSESGLSVSMDMDADDLLTEEELSSNSTIEFVLSVEEAADTVTETEKTAIAAEAGDNAVDVCYLSIDLTKYVDDEEGVAVTETASEITITVAIPDSLVTSVGDTSGSYCVIRYHNGTATTLEDQDDDDSTVTFSTDKFSTYAIAFVADEAEILMGDLNTDGYVNGRDLIYLRQYLAKADDAPTINMTAADLNEDGEVNGKDLIYLRKLLAG